MVWYWSNEYDGLIAVIDELWMAPAWRGQGIATALFERVLADHPEAIALDVEVSPATTLHSIDALIARLSAIDR